MLVLVFEEVRSEMGGSCCISGKFEFELPIKSESILYIKMLGRGLFPMDSADQRTITESAGMISPGCHSIKG